MRKTNRTNNKHMLDATAIIIAIIKLVQEVIISIIENK